MEVIGQRIEIDSFLRPRTWQGLSVGRKARCKVLLPAEHLMSTKYHEVSFEGKVLELVVMFSGKMHS